MRVQRQLAALRKAEEEGRAALARSEGARSDTDRRLEGAAAQVGGDTCCLGLRPAGWAGL